MTANLNSSLKHIPSEAMTKITDATNAYMQDAHTVFRYMMITTVGLLSVLEESKAERGSVPM